MKFLSLENGGTFVNLVQYADFVSISEHKSTKWAPILILYCSSIQYNLFNDNILDISDVEVVDLKKFLWSSYLKMQFIVHAHE